MLLKLLSKVNLILISILKSFIEGRQTNILPVIFFHGLFSRLYLRWILFSYEIM